MSSSTSTSQQRKLRWAAALLLVQGVLMEGLAFLGLFVLLALGIEQQQVTGFEFIVPFLQDHLYLMMAMSGVFAALRILGAVGILKNRMWGLALSTINCTVTLVLMIFLLPAGLVDGLLSGAALILILHAWYGKTPIPGVA